MAANNPDGTCKNQTQWTTAFQELYNLPQKVEYVRLYASSDCDTLINAVPAAFNSQIKILVGVWAENATHYQSETNALTDAITQYGADWIYAISVGSEDLYRGDSNAATLANQVENTRNATRALNVTVPIGHIDTWQAWCRHGHEVLVSACDFIGVDSYPYFQNSSIEAAGVALRNSVHAVQALSMGKPVWITETGKHEDQFAIWNFLF